MVQSTGKSNDESLTRALLTYNVTEAFGKEYVDVFYDMARMLVIQLVIQMLMHATDSDRFPFFSVEFVLMCIYIVLGVMVYWLIFKKAVQFK